MGRNINIEIGGSLHTELKVLASKRGITLKQQIVEILQKSLRSQINPIESDFRV